MNYKIYWLTGLIFFIFSSTSFGQIDTNSISSNFLKEYVPPNYKFHRLFLNPQLRESIVRSDALDRNRFTSSIYSVYSYLQQKDNADIESYTTVGFDLAADKRNEVRVDNDNFFNTTINSNFNRYFYLNSQAFFSAGAKLFSSNRFLYLTDNLNSFNQSFSIPLSIGFGRPYRVNDAWQAMNIFNDLECHGVASDRTQIKEVADLISTQRNTVFLDNRLGTIQNRTELLNYLNDNDIVSLSALSSAVIHDTYRYENFINRLSGFRIRGGVIPRLSFFRFGDGTDTPISDSEIALDPFFNFEYYIPISEDWQFDFFSYIIYESQEFSAQNTFKTTNIATLSWIPNLRTRTSTQLTFRSSDNELSLSTKSLGLNFSFEYYISPAVQWNVRAFFSQNWQELFGDKTNFFDQVFSAGFSYRMI